MATHLESETIFVSLIILGSRQNYDISLCRIWYFILRLTRWYTRNWFCSQGTGPATTEAYGQERLILDFLIFFEILAVWN